MKHRAAQLFACEGTGSIAAEAHLQVNAYPDYMGLGIRRLGRLPRPARSHVSRSHSSCFCIARTRAFSCRVFFLRLGSSIVSPLK